ncbi:hypothetical protein GCM10009839_37340 [Catenulispora yoronensis]|uniref:DUF3068 domain-containing protein n=1 Tax=Catenulispora yoronensis TaxID=450799 RepID=A0ABP5FVJ6_9ACTN
MLGVFGIVVVAVGALFEPVVSPMVSKLPSNTDMTVHYSGTANLIDQAAVAKGDLLGAFKNNQPLTLDRRIHVTATDGDTAIVADDQTLTIAGTPMPDNHVYALNRKTLEAGPAPAGKTADPASGIPIGWPLSPDPQGDYRYYDPTTQTSSDFTFTGDASVKGRSALTFHSSSAANPVKDKTLLATLPQALPKSVAQALAASPLPILPKEAQALLTPDVVAALPDTIPLTYTATTVADGAADKRVGFPIQQHLQQKVILNVALPGQPPVALMPVLTTDLTLTPDSQQYLVDKAKTTATELTLVKLVIPIAVVALGVLLLVVAFLRRNPKAQPLTPAVEGGPVAPAPGRTEPREGGSASGEEGDDDSAPAGSAEDGSAQTAED